MISLNGLSGGGQMLRTALSLSMITGMPFRMDGIRGGRSKPGLMRQHLTCVHAAAAICGATVEGAEIGSLDLGFRPGDLRGGAYQFAIGTAGSTMLLFQTLLPALLQVGAPSTLRLEGGTHNPLAPPFEFIKRVFLPTLARMGADVSLRLLESGFAPAGGGVVEAEITPEPRLRPCDFRERGERQALDVVVPIRGLSGTIGERILSAVLRVFPDAVGSVEARDPGPGRGVCVMVTSTHEHAVEMTTAIGEHGVSSEKVGHRAARAMQGYLDSGAPIGRHLADQLLLPMALAGGGVFRSVPPDGHVATNISIIEAFLPVRFRVSSTERGMVEISCQSRATRIPA